MLDVTCSETPPAIKTRFETLDSGLLKEKTKGRKKRKTVGFSPVYPKTTLKKVGATQLALGRDIVYDELLIHNSVAHSQERDREVFDWTALAALPHKEQSLLVVTEELGVEEDDPPPKSPFSLISISPSPGCR